jgi:hypothetical protein
LNGIKKFQPVFPVMASRIIILSNSVSGIGLWRDGKARAPFGIEAPRKKRRDRRPRTASINGNFKACSKPGGKLRFPIVSSLDPCNCHGRLASHACVPKRPHFGVQARTMKIDTWVRVKVTKPVSYIVKGFRLKTLEDG